MNTEFRTSIRIKILGLFGLFLFLSQNGLAGSGPYYTKDFVSEIDKKIPAWLEEFIVPGAAIALIDDGKIILQKGYGYSDVDKKIEVNAQTGFNIGSISKTVAAWGVMKLVEEGKLELDSPAEKYLTRWHFPESEFDVNGVTIRRLLSHTAGLSLHGYPGWGPNDTLPTVEQSLSGKNNGPGDVKLIMEPGTKWKYSGGGFTVLQLIIEEVTGRKFADYVQSEIIDPLGMKNSSYNIDDKILSRSSLEHNSYGDVIPFEYFAAEAAAGFQTTIEDFTLFALASLNTTQTKKKNQSVLKASTIKLMTSPAPASNGYYGLGYDVDSIANTSTVMVGHGGANSGWHAILKVDRQSQDGFVMFTNGGSGAEVYRQAFCDWIQWKVGVSLGNRCKKGLTPTLIRTYRAGDIDATIASYKKLKETESDSYFFYEGLLNNYGYSLLGIDDLQGAIAIFKLNTEEYPDAWNVFDSLGEAYAANGDTDLAIVNYQRSIDLNPENTNGIEVLKKLKGE